jgi:hypothetical protein
MLWLPMRANHGGVAEPVGEGEHVAGGVQALVEPGLGGLVGGEHALEVLVAELVDGGEDAAKALFEAEEGDPRGRVEDVGGGEEGRVFHALGALGGVGRVDDGDRGPGVGAEAGLHALEGGDEGLEVAGGVGEAIGLEELTDPYVLPHGGGLDEGGVGGPGEVVDHLGAVVEALAAVGGRIGGDEDAAGADDHRLGDVEVDVVVAEVGVELGVEGEDVGTPDAVGLQNADLGEPLAEDVELVGVAGAGEDLGELGEEVELDDDALAGLDGCGEGDGGEGGVVALGGGEGGDGSAAGLDGSPGSRRRVRGRGGGRP